MVMQWGDKIQHEGEPPFWLARNDVVKVACAIGGDHMGPAQSARWDYAPRTFRLNSRHIAYQALAAGFVPWGGDWVPPADWNAGPVLLRNGKTVSVADDCGPSWRHCKPHRWPFRRDHSSEIIGYRRKSSSAAYIPERELERMAG